jgi:hypothetical protein
MNVDLIIKNLPALLAAAFVAVLFIQSGLDKVFDWKGNLEWLTGHFSKTFVAGAVPVMLAVITAMEIATGFLSAAGVIYFLATGSTAVMFTAGALGATSITSLFFGQRLAKDYAGAAVLVPYFILMLALMFLTSPRV